MVRSSFFIIARRGGIVKVFGKKKGPRPRGEGGAGVAAYAHRRDCFPEQGGEVR